MLRRTVKTIHKLRVYFLAFFLIATFYYIGQQPADMSRFFGAGFSRAIGMSTSVPENEINSLVSQLDEKKKNLEIKENELDKQELSLARNKYAMQTKLMIFMVAGICLLFILIILNYYLDYRRRKKRAGENFNK